MLKEQEEQMADKEYTLEEFAMNQIIITKYIAMGWKYLIGNAYLNENSK